MSTALGRGRAPLRMAVLAAALLLAPGAAAADGFVPGTQDLPLMRGLAPVAEEALVFDKPTGRIVQAEATGTLPADAVRRFYADTLPQLGWTAEPGAAGAQRWVREGERLDMALEGRGGRTLVRFTLSPRDAAPGAD